MREVLVAFRIIVRAPLWLSHSGAKGVGAKRVLEKGGPESFRKTGREARAEA
jgi:hypothetical protein